MAAEPDLEGSLIVEIITYTFYFGWLAILSAIALYIGVPPLPDIQVAIQPPWQGTVAAITAGTAFIAASTFCYAAIRKRLSPQQTESAPKPEHAEPAPPRSEKKKRRKKSRKRKKR